MTKIEFWFDFASMYSYLSAMRIEEMCSKRGIELVWRPFLLGPIFRQQGWESSPFVVYPNRGRYMWKDLERQARKYHLPYKKPISFPQNGVLASRIALAASDQAWLSNFIKSIFRAEYEAEKEISDPELVKSVLRSIGVDAEEWIQRATTPQNKEALKKQTDEAERKGIFGAPTFFVGAEMFWGNDRLEDACEFAVGS